MGETLPQKKYSGGKNTAIERVPKSIAVEGALLWEEDCCGKSTVVGKTLP